MNRSELIFATSRPYSSLLKDLFIFDKLFSSKQLAFNMQAQTQTNWCWAATSTSVSHFYWLWSTWTQCKVANAELGLSGCCANSVPAACNVPWYLDRALTRTNNFVSITGSVSFEQVRAEIDAGRPVGARIGWSGGGGHFMVIYGYSLVAGTQYFDIDDPIYGKSHLTVADFSSNYQGSGTWTHTYFTKSYVKMPIKFLIPDDLILRRIWEVRPLLSLKQEGSSGRAGGRATEQEESASVGIAQRIFVVGLDALLSEQEIAPAPVGLRVYEVVEDTPRAFFDLSEGAEPRLLQMSTAANHLEPFARGLATVQQFTEQRSRERKRAAEDEEAELKLFRVPALNFEALWLSYENTKEDMLVPLRPLAGLTVGEPVPLEEALAALREAGRPLAGMDDTMGA